MNIRHYFTVSLVTKITFFFLCVLLIRIHFVTGQNSALLLDSNQSTNTIQTAINKGANVNVRNTDGYTALMLAAGRSDLPRAQLLLSRGADVNLVSKKNKETALHLAASSADDDNSLKIVILLLRYGANVHAKNAKGDTPLHKAINIRGNYANRRKVFSLLIKHGADINAQNNNGSTPLHMLVGMLDVQGIQDLMIVFGQLFDLSKKTKTTKFTPIQFAKDIGATNIVDLLNQPIIPLGTTGNNVDIYNEVGFNGFMLATIAGNQSLAQQLLLRGASINLRTRDNYNYSPLQLALLQRNLKMIEFLLKNQANPSLHNAAGDTALHTVLRVPDLAMQKKELRLLAKYNADFNAPNNNGGSILHLIVRLNNKPLLAYLVKNYKKRLNVNLENLDYDTPIDLAEKLDRKTLIPLLEKLRSR